MAAVDTVVELTRQLVRFDTTNPPGNEEPAIRYLGAYLTDAGIEVEYQQLESNRANLVARLRGHDAGGHLVFSGHMDVVPVGEGWDCDPFAADITDGRIVGRGTADMKGGVAAMTTAMVELARSDVQPRADLVLAVSCGEEVRGMQGARLMASTGILKGASMLVVGEPTDLDLCIAQKGVNGWSITAHGRPCHGSTPHLGVSAISYIAHLIPALETCPFPYTEHAVLGKPTVNVMTITGGTALNVIPDRCTISAIMRTVPGQEYDRNTAILHEVVERIATEERLPVRTEITGGSLPAIETALDDPFLLAAREAVRGARGSEPRLLPFTGATEAAILAPAYHMHTVIFGPGSLSQAHEPNEYVDIAELETATEAYVRLTERLLS
jgi:succinyl-diaminopimelate desuccinylase